MSRGFRATVGRAAVDPTYVSPGFRDGFVADSEGRLEPSDSFFDLYVLSDRIWGNQAGQQYQYTANHGDDDAPGTFESPIRTLVEVERRLRAGNGHGVHARVFLMGYGGPDFDHPTEGRVYMAQFVRTSFGNGAHDSFRTNVSYIGPRAMLSQTSAVTYVSAVNVANGSHRVGKMKLTTSSAISAATYHVRWLRADGREVFAPFQVEENDAGDGAAITSICNASYFAAHVEAGDTFRMVIPAVCIASRGFDSTFEAVHVVGDGPHRIGDRVAAVEPTHDTNLWPTFERIAFAGRATCDVQGDVLFETCNFRDGLSIGPGCAARGRGNAIESGLSYQGAEVYRTSNSQFVAALDPSCRTIVTDGQQDPVNVQVGLDWCISGQGAGLEIQSGATLRVLRGLGLNMKLGGSVGAYVRGRGRLIMDDRARVCVTMATNPAYVGFWATSGGEIRANDGPVQYAGFPDGLDLGADAGPVVYGTDLHVKVGDEDPVAFGAGTGQLRDPYGAAGNLISAFDRARVWVPSTEPANYDKAGADAPATVTLTTDKYIYVNPATGSDVSGSGDLATPFATIQRALDLLYADSPRLTSPRVVFVTGQALIREQVTIPPFESAIASTFDVAGDTPLTLIEEPINIYGDLEYGTQTPVTATAWGVCDATTGLRSVTVTGLNVLADAVRGRVLLGTGLLQMAWVGRNDATVAGSTTLYLAGVSQLTAPLRLGTPIELRAPDAATGATVIARGVRSGIGILGLKVSSPASVSVNLADVAGEVWFGGTNLEDGYQFTGVAHPQFYQCRLSSGSSYAARASYALVCELPGGPPAHTYCLLDGAHFLARGCGESHYASYLRYCNDAGHGGGTFLARGSFDFSNCHVDECTGQGSGHAFNYNGGDPCSLEAVYIRPGTTSHGVCAREFGGLRVKNVTGSCGGYGINVGIQASPMLAGSGTVRISSTTTITGTFGDMRIGTLDPATTTYAILRALPSGSRRITDASRFATVWENS